MSCTRQVKVLHGSNGIYQLKHTFEMVFINSAPQADVVAKITQIAADSVGSSADKVQVRNSHFGELDNLACSDFQDPVLAIVGEPPTPATVAERTATVVAAANDDDSQFNVGKVVAWSLNERADRIQQGEFGRREEDVVARWLREALKQLRSTWEIRQNDSRMQPVISHVRLIPEYRRNLRRMLDSLPATQNRDEPSSRTAQMIIVWGPWQGDVVESVSITDQGQPLKFALTVRILRSNLSPPRYEMSFE